MASSSYRVDLVDGCTLIFGLIPVDHLVALGRTAGDAVMSPDLAQMAKANIAFGSMECVTALAARLRAERLRGPVPVELAGLSAPAQQWLQVGRLGSSSCTMFYTCVGFLPGHLKDREGAVHHPYDPSDFSLCQLLIEAVPEVEGSYRLLMPKVSRVWAALIARWPLIVSAMDEESPGWRTGKLSSPKAYTLIRDAIECAG